MDSRLVKVVAGLALLGFVVSLVPSGGQDRSVTIRHKSKNKADVRARTAVKLAASLVTTLPRILERFRARRRELLARSTDAGYPQAEVASLLDSTEDALRKEFKKPDFAPLRDHVAEVFDHARSELGLPTSTAFHFTPVPLATLASLHLAAVAEDVGSRLERVLGGIEALLADLQERATRKDLIVDLCVVSAPPEAKVSMHTPGGRKIDPTETNDRFENLIRGKYSYTVHKRRFADIESAVNLYDKKQPLLDCKLGESECVVREGWSGACRGR